MKTDSIKHDSPAQIQDATLLEILMNSLPDTIYFKDAQGQFLKINNQQAKMLGLQHPNEAMGKSDFDFFPEDFAQEARQDELKIMSSDKPISSKLEKLRDGQGRVQWLSATKAPIHDEQGRVIGIVGVSRDVTQREKIQKQINELNTLRELLLDIITHDLRNPAAVIFSLSDLAVQESPTDEILQGIYTTSKSMLAVLESTTILSQAAFGEKIPLADLSLNQIIASVVEEYALALKNAEMELEMVIAENISIHANPLISEIFKNYISNAIKYAQSGKKIILEALQDKSGVLVKVRDFGTTIPENVREEVFERRTQLEGKLKAGRGLGLAIVKRIASAHDGQAWVEPNLPRGNVFCLRLPGPADQKPL